MVKYINQSDEKNEAQRALEIKNELLKQLEEKRRSTQKAYDDVSAEVENARKALFEALASGNVEAIAKAKAELKAAKTRLNRIIRSSRFIRKSSDDKTADKPSRGLGDNDPLGGLEW